MRDEFPRACPPPDESKTPDAALAMPATSASDAAEELVWIAGRAGLDAAACEELRNAMADWSRRFARRNAEGESRPQTEEAGLLALTVDRLRRFLRTGDRTVDR